MQNNVVALIYKFLYLGVNIHTFLEFVILMNDKTVAVVVCDWKKPENDVNKPIIIWDEIHHQCVWGTTQCKIWKKILKKSTKKLITQSKILIKYVEKSFKVIFCLFLERPNRKAIN